VVTQNTARLARHTAAEGIRTVVVCDPVQAAETILRRFGARAVSNLSQPRTLEDGRVLPPRLSANDGYVALEEACRKMARVAIRKFESDALLKSGSFSDALDQIFPDATAYLARCIRSVISDTERVVRRDVPTVSMDQPLAGGDGGSTLTLGDTFATEETADQPEEALIDRDERQQSAPH